MLENLDDARRVISQYGWTFHPRQHKTSYYVRAAKRIDGVWIGVYLGRLEMFLGMDTDEVSSRLARGAERAKRLASAS